MLTGKMVRVRYVKNQLVPLYLDTSDPMWTEMAERLLEIYRARVNSTRGELEDDIKETFDNAPSPQIHQGLAKLLEDRSEFSVVCDRPPEELRDLVFRTAVVLRKKNHGERQTDEDAKNPEADSEQDKPIVTHPSPFNRQDVLNEAARTLEMSVAELEQGLFADLRSEQQLISLRDISAERLVQRYNVALAQALLLRAVKVKVLIRDEKPARYRQLLRLIKFHRLMCETEVVSESTLCLRLDGPLSLFSATQKYGLQLAIFLPAVLLCKEYEIHADILWGPKKSEKTFVITPRDGLVSHYADRGMYVPQEIAMFVELFEKRTEDWLISQEPDLLTLGESYWVPDFQLIHKESGQVIYLDVLGFWRKSAVERHLTLLRKHAPEPFILAISEQMRVDEDDLDALGDNIVRFRQMPLPKDIIKAAEGLLQGNKKPKPKRKKKKKTD